MKVNIITFVVGFILAFAIGAFVFSDSSDSNNESPSGNETEVASENVITDGTESTEESETEQETIEGETVSDEAEVLSANNCLSCHAVESLGIEGGTTGTDLSNAYNDVEKKHGKDLDSFLQEPTSAVMSTVIADNPLPDEEREKIIEVLKKAAEQ